MLEWEKMLARVPEALRRKYGLLRIQKLHCACGSDELVLSAGQCRCADCVRAYDKLADIPESPVVR